VTTLPIFTPWSIVLHEKLIVIQLVMNFPVCCGTGRFTTRCITVLDFMAACSVVRYRDIAWTVLAGTSLTGGQWIAAGFDVGVHSLYKHRKLSRDESSRPCWVGSFVTTERLSLRMEKDYICGKYSSAIDWTRLLRRQLMTYTITSSPKVTRFYFQKTSGIHTPVGKTKGCSLSGRSPAPIADSFHVATMARKQRLKFTRN
jgi:hypothetical protein